MLGVITPGTHGSTFGGNPLAAAIGREVVAMLETGEFQERAAKLGEQLTPASPTWSGTASTPSGPAACGPASTSAPSNT